MDERRDVATGESTEARTQERRPEVVLRPPVDICEDAEGITLLADMPGVSKERLEIHVDRDTLTIDGDVHIEMPEGMEAMHADVKSTHYRRSFTLSNELATDQIDANLKDGVLSLRIPKRAEAKPRRIEVRSE